MANKSDDEKVKLFQNLHLMTILFGFFNLFMNNYFYERTLIACTFHTSYNETINSNDIIIMQSDI